ncbi:hypothetical protein D3C87_1987440 [compost metagenome]
MLGLAGKGLALEGKRRNARGGGFRKAAGRCLVGDHADDLSREVRCTGGGQKRQHIGAAA